MSCEQASTRSSTTPDGISHLFARHQRNRYTSALSCDPDVLAVIHTGSLPAGSSPQYAKDVDLVLVLPQPMLQDLTPALALRLTQDLIRRRVSPEGASIRTQHAVRCEWTRQTPLGPLERLVENPPPVDVMPAYQRGSRIVVPSRDKDEWTSVDPEAMNRLVGERQRQWNHFGDIARMARAWNRHRGLGLNSVDLEVLVLTFMPRPEPWQTLTRGEALARFFYAAAREKPFKSVDSALNQDKLQAVLHDAADLARAAADAATDGDRQQAEHLWSEIFGDAFGPGWLIALLRWTWGDQPAQLWRPDVHADWPA